MWREVLRSFWGPFEQAVTATSGVGMTAVIDELDALVGAHFFPAQASPFLAPTHQFSMTM